MDEINRDEVKTVETQFSFPMLPPPPENIRRVQKASLRKTQDGVPKKLLSGDPAQVEIPDRLYFKIGDVAQIIGVKPYVLRYWETEFSQIRPVKSSTGQRLFRRKDVEWVLLIKRLLYGEKFSIEGARRRIKELMSSGELKDAKKVRLVIDDKKAKVLNQIRDELQKIQALCRNS